MTRQRLTLPKSERLTSRKTINSLFEGGSRSLASYPIRVVYRIEKKRDNITADSVGSCKEKQNDSLTTSDNITLKVMFSVSKRHFKHAVDRNRIKRQMREAYRHAREVICQKLANNTPTTINMVFIYSNNQIISTSEVMTKTKSLLTRMIEKYNEQQ